MRGKYTAVYIRRAFEVADPRRTRKLVLAIRYDDAFIAYLNGREVLRVGVGRGRGATAAKVKGHEAKDYERFELAEAAALLRAGTNVLAIEGHNDGATSSDFSLDPYLVRDAAGAGPPPRLYTVRLHFAEMGAARPGERVFGVGLQGKPVVERLDVAKAAGGARRGVVRECRGIAVRDALRIDLTPARGSRRPALLCGVEIVAEGW